jgi:NAD(P)-dependent dehydrogenase (short-subunit alcohol dehydrogenase family)
MSDRRNAIVTGATSGLGRAIALRLARDGSRIALCDIDIGGAAETLSLVRGAGGDGFVHRLDIAELDEWQLLAERLETEFEHLDLLVNNAGIGASGEVGQFSIDQWRRVLDIDLLGAIYGCHTFVERLKQNPRGGHIINTASFAAMASAPAMAAYNVAKAGVLALSETLYAELRQQGVGVTVICPMFFRTKLLEGWSCGGEAERLAAEFYTENAGFTADDVADAAVRAMNRKRLYVVIGAKARWYWRLKRLAPQWFLNLMASRYAGWLKRAGKSRSHVPRPKMSGGAENVLKK